MYAANRKLTPDDLTKSFERFDKLSRKTAQSIVAFQAHSQKQRVHGEAPDGSAGGDLALLALAGGRAGEAAA